MAGLVPAPRPFESEKITKRKITHGKKKDKVKYLGAGP